MGAGDVIANLARLLHETAFRIERDVFALLWSEILQFTDGVAQKVFLFLERFDLRFGVLKRGACGLKIAPGGARSRHPIVEAAEIIKHRAVAARVQQPAIIVLTVKLDERVG